ncbi:hypothetical protein ScPMuIL_000376 [Solemya velum]
MAKGTKKQDGSLPNGGLLPESNDTTVGLKQNLGLLSGTAMIVGTMIGSGIFISPKGVLEGTGSVALSLIIWTMCGLLATMGALSYAELGTAIPESGGEHAYLMYTYRPMSKTLGQIPAFLYIWVGIFIIRPTMFAVISLALGTYVVKPFFPMCEYPDLAVKIVTIVAMLIITFINAFSVKIATMVQNFFTFAKLIAIAMIIIGGIIKIAMGNIDYIGEGFEDTRQDPSLIAIAFYNGLWSFDGWNNLNFVTEELKRPEKNLPRSIMIGIPLVTVCYVLTNIGYFSVMSKEEILLSHAVAVTWGDRVLGVMSWSIPVFVAMSCFGAANGILFSTARLCYTASRAGHLPQILSYIHIRRLTPVPSILFTALVSIILIIPGDIDTLIDFYSFCAWIVYGGTVATLLVLRRTKRDIERPYKVPIFIPILVVIISCYLVISPIIQSPRIQFLYAFLFILSGLFVYVPVIHYKKHPPFMGKLTLMLQKLLEVVPSKKD